MDQHAVSYFKKQANRLLRLAKDGDPQALVRLGPNDSPGIPSLMRAQHAIAKEAGFPGWGALLEAPDVEAQLAAVMHRVPLLCDHGLGVFNVPKPSREERDRLLAEARLMLRRSIDDVAKTIVWLLKNIAKIKTVNRSSSSYGLKHCTERDIGYITNGVFIAAAIIEGYGYREDLPSPNVCFAMSKRSINAVYERQNRRW